MHNQSTLYYAKYCLGYENISSLLLTLTPFACVVVAFYAGNRRTRGDETDHVRRKCDGRWLLSGHMVSGKEHGGTACVLRTDQFGWAVASGMVLP